MNDDLERMISLTPEEALVKMKEIPFESDEVSQADDHQKGDAILCALLRHLGHDAVVDEWEKRSEAWWWA